MNDWMNGDKPHEECGVIGLIGPVGENVSKDIYYGLVALQHRGQESAGISVSDTDGPKGNIETVKGMGLVSEVFEESTLEKLKGNIGVGHVRYSTSGESSLKNAQPIAMNYIKGSLALVHNGNIMNAAALKEKQMYRGQAHYSTTDSEVLAYEIISERIHTDSIEQAVLGAAAKLKGGYAIIVMSPRKLIAMRDPLGIRPLVLGKREDTYILASESAAIHSLGGTFIRDILPGEIVTVTIGGIQSNKTLCQRQAAHCVFEYIYFARTDSVIDSISVRNARFRAGQALAERDALVEADGLAEANPLAGADALAGTGALAEAGALRQIQDGRKSSLADLVAGVPDSGLIAAEGYSFSSGIPYASVFHKNSYIGRSFIKPSDKERRDAVHMKLNVLPSVVYEKRILLIDDSIVRGTTMREIIRALKKAGAREVHVRISSPPFLYPCYYGTDVPTAQQLIASDHSTEEIRKKIGADSLAYLQIEDFQKMTGGLPLCTACFDGKYPVR